MIWFVELFIKLFIEMFIREVSLIFITLGRMVGFEFLVITWLIYMISIVDLFFEGGWMWLFCIFWGGDCRW